MSKIIGIDLGTSNSAAAVLEGGKPKIIPSAEGATQYGKSFPSVVAFTKKEGMLLVGEPARRQTVSNPGNTVMKVKRKMGTDHKYKLNGKEYTPQQISAFILQKIKKDAEMFLGEKVEKAVITVPAYFDDNQRQATQDAGKIAGIEVVRVLNEPTAASLAYGVDKKGVEYKILVFDLGGGTLDVTIMEFGDGVFEVKSTSGDTELGGTDMDLALVEYIVKEFKDKEDIDLKQDSMAMERIRDAAEKAKIELSTVLETDLNLPYISSTNTGPKHLQLTRAKLESIVDGIIKKCKKPIEEAIKGAGIKTSEIDKIILVGGPTRMPSVQKFVEEVLGKKPERGIDPMECVAQGAAVQAGVLTGEVQDLVLLDVTPLSLGIETLGGIFTKLIEKNTTIPTKNSEVFSTSTDNQPSVGIKIAQGERPMFSDNKSLGNFELMGILPAPRGMPQIEVTFDIDANGIVHVTAKDKGTEKEQSIRITSSQKLSEDEIEKMKKDAESHAEEDKKRKEEMEVINEADNLVYSTEKMYEEVKGKADESLIENVKKEIHSLKDLLKEEPKNIEKIKENMKKASEAIQKMSVQVYEKAQKEQQAQAANQTQDASSTTDNKEQKQDENVVDAEVVEDEDNKKENAKTGDEKNS